MGDEKSTMHDEHIWADFELPDYDKWVKKRYPMGIPVIYALKDLLTLIKKHKRTKVEFVVAIPYTSLEQFFPSRYLKRIRLRTISWMLEAKNMRVIVMMPMDSWLDRMG